MFCSRLEDVVKGWKGGDVDDVADIQGGDVVVDVELEKKRSLGFSLEIALRANARTTAMLPMFFTAFTV